MPPAARSRNKGLLETLLQHKKKVLVGVVIFLALIIFGLIIFGLIFLGGKINILNLIYGNGSVVNVVYNVYLPSTSGEQSEI